LAAYVQNWKKFGECEGAPAGPEKGVTSVADEIFIEVTMGVVEKPEGGETKIDAGVGGFGGIVCKNCGKMGDHFTPKCPLPKKAATTGGVLPTPGAYVPPSRRGQATRTEGGNDRHLFNIHD
jgi:hypothetical protein